MKTLLHVMFACTGRILAIALAVGGCSEATESAAEPATDNPVPSIRSITPTAVTAGAKAMSFSIVGTNFVRGSVVRWNGSDRVTGFHGDTLLGAGILEGDLARAAAAQITVYNSAPAGGTSNAMTFSILDARSDGRKTVVHAFRLPAGYAGDIRFDVSVGAGPVDITLDFSGDYVILACVGMGVGCFPMLGRPGTRTINFPAGSVRASLYFSANQSQPPGDAVGTLAFTFNPF
jgi:hypothetical protein